VCVCVCVCVWRKHLIYSVINSKIHFDCVITISMCGVDSVYRLKYTELKLKDSASEHLKTDVFISSLLSGKSCISSSCVHYELTLCNYVLMYSHY